MQKSVIFFVFFCLFSFCAHSQQHATRTMKKEMKAYNKKMSVGGATSPGSKSESFRAKAPKKPFLQRIGIIKENQIIPHFFEATARQEKKTSKRMKKNLRKASKRMRKRRLGYWNDSIYHDTENMIVFSFRKPEETDCEI